MRVRKVIEKEVLELFYQALNFKDDVKYFLENIRKVRERFFTDDTEEVFDLDYMIRQLVEMHETADMFAHDMDVLKEEVMEPSEKWKPWVEVDEDSEEDVL